MPDIDPKPQPANLEGVDDAAERDPALEAEPRSFGGEAQGEGVRYGDDTQDDETARLADALPEDAEVEGEIAADDAGATAMAERAGRDIEQEGR